SAPGENADSHFESASVRRGDHKSSRAAFGCLPPGSDGAAPEKFPDADPAPHWRKIRKQASRSGIRLRHSTPGWLEGGLEEGKDRERVPGPREGPRDLRSAGPRRSSCRAE